MPAATDTALIDFATEFREGILAGRRSASFCAIVSVHLASVLAAFGLQTEVMLSWVGSGWHVWLRLADGRVLDPTADQFVRRGLPPVYLGEPTDIHQNPKLFDEVVDQLELNQPLSA